MKKLVSILFVILIGFSTSLGQSTGYVTVTWDNDCQACCLGMVYAPCITVVRVVDDYVVVENLCDTVNGSTHSYRFSFDMPDCPTNAIFKVYAAVWAGCDGGPLCCHEKNPGLTTDCSHLEDGDFQIPIDF